MSGTKRLPHLISSGGLRPGFTLLEVMVAMAILGISIVVIMELFSAGLKSAKASQDYTKIIMLARQKMDQLTIGRNLAEGVDGGEFEGTPYRWQTEIKAYEPEDTGQDLAALLSAVLSGQAGQGAAAFSSDKKPPFEIFEITTKVLWGDEKKPRSFELKTIKTNFKATKTEQPSPQ